jgi:hypothetical protein
MRPWPETVVRRPAEAASIEVVYFMLKVGRCRHERLRVDWV